MVSWHNTIQFKFNPFSKWWHHFSFCSRWMTTLRPNHDERFPFFEKKSEDRWRSLCSSVKSSTETLAKEKFVIRSISLSDKLLPFHAVYLTFQWIFVQNEKQKGKRIPNQRVMSKRREFLMSEHYCHRQTFTPSWLVQLWSYSPSRLYDEKSVVGAVVVVVVVGSGLVAGPSSMAGQVRDGEVAQGD